MGSQRGEHSICHRRLFPIARRSRRRRRLIDFLVRASSSAWHRTYVAAAVLVASVVAALLRHVGQEVGSFSSEEEKKKAKKKKSCDLEGELKKKFISPLSPLSRPRHTKKTLNRAITLFRARSLSRTFSSRHDGCKLSSQQITHVPRRQTSRRRALREQQ